MTTYQTNNLTANTSRLNHDVSHSDMRSHQILHRGEQQLIYLQRPPPPSPLKIESRQSEGDSARALQQHYHRTGSVDSGASLDAILQRDGGYALSQP